MVLAKNNEKAVEWKLLNTNQDSAIGRAAAVRQECSCCAPRMQLL